MRLVIVTGISGAGKSTALDLMEDMDYYCVDNLPPMLLETFIRLYKESKSKENSKIAVGIDIRGGEFFDDIMGVIANIEDHDVTYEILFLDAEDAMILSRYKESRRTHPLSKGGRIQEGIDDERSALGLIKENANYIIDTSKLSIWELRQKVRELFQDDERTHNFPINVISFGFKYGVPRDADVMFDVRFITNPHYIKELRPHTGLDDDVHSYVMKFDETKEFLKKLYDMVDFLIPLYVKEGKGQLSIAIGCTGGKHRSVTIAEELKDYLRLQGLYVKAEHIHIKR